jgi:hypothetical protein
MIGDTLKASTREVVSTRYLQDIHHFLAKSLIRRV